MKRGESGRILVVDDQRTVAEMTAGLLRNLGHEVQVVLNGEAALEQVRSGRFDLVVCDIMMPGMDGYAAMTVIRQMPQFATLPIIAVTARAMPSDRQKSLAAGASDYVTKPVDTDELLNCMERWLAGS